jgi:hypothetical protein
MEKFSSPIPVWIRIYGFGVLLLMVALLVTFSFYFKVKRVAQIKLLKYNNTFYAEYLLGEYETIKALDTAQIELATGQSFKIVFISKESSLNKNNIHTSIVVLNADSLSPYFHHADELNAVVIIENSSLLSKVFKNSKPLKI